MTYKEQIKSPFWQRKRLEILNMYDFKCADCKCTDKQLHVHHLIYISGLKIWEYDNELLLPLCNECHNSAHEILKIIALIAKKIILEKIDINNILK